MRKKVLLCIAILLAACCVMRPGRAAAQSCANNLPPVANPNTRTVNEGAGLFVASSAPGSANNLLTNDSDPENGPVTITGYTVAGQSGTPVIGTPFNVTDTFPDGSVGIIGALTINANGSYAFSFSSANPNFNGTFPAITYTISDTCGATAGSTLDITVNPVADCPQVIVPSRNVLEDGTLAFNNMSIADDDGPGGTGYTFTMKMIYSNTVTPYTGSLGFFTASSANGVTVAGSGTDSLALMGNFTDINAYLANSALIPVYTAPGPDLNSSCLSGIQIRTRLYQAGISSAADGHCDQEVRNMNITAVADALNYSVSTCQNAAKSFNVLTGTGTASGQANSFEANTAAPPQAVTVTAINGAPIVNPVATTNGQITVNSDGSVSYVPNTGYTGVDSFTYTAQPGTGCAETRKVTLNVQAAPAAPTLNTVQPTCTTATGSITVTAPTGQTYSINSISYQSSTTFSNVAAGTYSVTVRNSSGCISPITSATITQPDCTPVAVNDTATTPADTAVSGNLAQNDTCSNASCSYSTTPATPPAGGSVTINPDGTYTYTPNPGFTGNDMFAYTLCDADGDCDTAQVFITVSSPLPADLLSFTAGAGTGCTVQLSWTTGVEKNLDHFGIEWGTDGAAFTKAGSVMARGSGSSYTYVYRDALPGISYFRLRLSDRDGSYSYSPVAPLNLGCTPGGKIRVYPTLVTALLTVEGLQPRALVAVYDIKGSRVQQARAGGATMELNLSQLSSGSYWIMVMPLTGAPLRYRIVKQ